MKKLFLSFTVLTLSTFAFAAGSLESEFFARSNDRLDLLIKSGGSVKKSCFDQTLSQLKLTNQVTRFEDAQADAGYVFQLKNGDVCMTGINLRNMKTNTLCHSKTLAVTVSAESSCNDSL